MGVVGAFWVANGLIDMMHLSHRCLLPIRSYGPKCTGLRRPSRHVRFGSQADIRGRGGNVRSPPKSGRARDRRSPALSKMGVNMTDDQVSHHSTAAASNVVTVL